MLVSKEEYLKALDKRLKKAGIGKDLRSTFVEGAALGWGAALASAGLEE